MKRIVTANSSHCCIYDYPDHQGRLKLIKEFDHPENKMKSSELLTDKPGHYNNQRNHGAFTKARTVHDINVDNFARELAHELEQELNRHDFTELVLVMPPHMEGLLDLHLTKQVREAIKYSIQKNMIHCSAKELLDYLKTHLSQNRKSWH